MCQLVDLTLECVIISRIMISQCIYCNSGSKIKIFFAFCVIEIAAFAVVDDDGREDFGVFHLLSRMPDVF